MTNARTPVRIGNRAIGPEEPPFIIAELSGNHNQSLERALAIVDAAADAGADALKLQTYTADTMTLDIDTGEFFIQNPDSLWQGESLYRLYEKAHTPWAWHAPIMQRCQEKGLLCFSSPFDATAVDFLESLNAPAYKIASFELPDLPLIRRVAQTGKPVILSTGMATEADIDDAVTAAREAGCRELILLQCTSNYPADASESHLQTIPWLRERFNTPVGLSDHTPGATVPVAAVALGAVVIEKHVTLSRAEGGVDAAFSLEPHELKALVTDTRLAHRALGRVQIGQTESEKKSLQFRRSLYISADMRAGDHFSPENVRAIRPGYGLPPKFYEALLGRRVTQNAPRGTALCWDLVEGGEPGLSRPLSASGKTAP
ncbi:MAG: pseudaminic acid synthase [Candidatus Melainabacteria bacterium]